MHDIGQCIVCSGENFETLYPATFNGQPEDAVPYFLTNRKKAVHGRIVRCLGCGFVVTSPQFEPQDYARIYAGDEFDGEDRGRQEAGRRRFQSLTARVRRHVAQGRYLDFGCGDGAFLKIMGEELGTGFETRPSSAQAAPENPASNIITGDFIGFSADPANGWTGAFDFVTAWNVLEHLPDLGGHMKAIHRVLKDDGFFFCTLPDISSLAARLSGRRWNCMLLEHLWFFSPRTFRTYAEKNGFQVLESTPVMYPVALETLLLRLAQTFGLRAAKLPDIFARRIIHLPIGLMFIALRKRPPPSS